MVKLFSLWLGFAVISKCIFISSGSDVNAKYKKGLTPIQEVATKGDKSIVEILKKHRAKE